MKETNKVHETIKEIKELHPNGEKQLITLTGITTSQINQALKAVNPYPARVFLKVENEEQDIPVFFRIKENCQFHSHCSQDCRYKSWIRPKIKTGSYLQVEGYFSALTNSLRKSFTAYSYSLLNQELEAKEVMKNYER